MAFLCLAWPAESKTTLHEEGVKQQIEQLTNDPEVKKLHENFKEQLDRIMSAKAVFVASGLTPYESCLSQLRKKLGPPPPEKWQIDVVKVICEDAKVTKAESKLKEEIQKTDFVLRRKELTLRFITLINTTFSNWNGAILENGSIFQQNCGLDERCLELKQSARRNALVLSSVARLNLIELEKRKDKWSNQKVWAVLEPDSLGNLSEILRKAKAATEQDLKRTFRKLYLRVDLPW